MIVSTLLFFSTFIFSASSLLFYLQISHPLLSLLYAVFHKSVTDVSGLDGYMELLKTDQELLRNRLIKSSTEEDEDAKPLDPDLLVRKVWTERKEPSEDLLMPLLPYQKEGLAWMSSQEHSDVHGGILADEMGMGQSSL